MKKIPLLVKVIAAILAGVLLGQIMPDIVIRGMNTLCGVFDQLLRFLIPIIIVGLVTPAIAEVGGRAGKMLLLTVVLAYAFTVFSGLFAYVFSSGLFPSVLPHVSVTAFDAQTADYPAFFTINVPPLMDVMTALVFSFMVGLGIAAFDGPALKRGFSEFKTIVSKTIEFVIIPLLPFYIFGIFLNMAAVGQVAGVLTAFLSIVAIIFAMTLVLLLLQYGLAGILTHRNPLRLLRTMLPAWFTALGTASSAATIPVTLRQALRNRVSEPVAGFVVPLCATIHLSGSTLKITSCAIALMLMQGIDFDFPTMLAFIMMLGVTMVAAPGVPGGAIMAALGVLESMLGFDSGQQTMMITLYIAMDSFGTACNVTGDGAIALIVNRLHKNGIWEISNQEYTGNIIMR
ncbi:MAG: dicarboxylate/amino acid:cation symporter [Bacteroidaceae bacterium]|nr:dicarboxylate/amino acid:cation symporter [Bacteroidaceae bacterium]